MLLDFPGIMNVGYSNHNQNNLQGLQSLPFQAEPKLRQLLERLPHPLQQLYNIMFNSANKPYKFNQVLPFEPKPSASYACNKEVTRKEKSFRCLDCSLHEGALICQSCFQQASHKNHRYLMVKEDGSCDCGNEAFLKQEGFCKKHRKESKMNEVQIGIQDRIKFKLFIRQIFVWIFTLWSKIHTKSGVYLLSHFILYLSDLNKESRYYNLLTTQVLFEGNHPIISQMFQIIFADFLQKQLVKTFVSFLLMMLRSQQFKEALLPIVINVYNNSQIFDNHDIEKILIVLLSDSRTISSVMPKISQTLDPTKRKYNPSKYYEHLMMLSYLKTDIAQIFLRPLIEKSSLPSPLLVLLEERCEKGGQPVLSIVTENVQEEYGYYQVLAMIIHSVNSQDLLKQMIVNYYQMIYDFSFKKNKIVLIPHRVFALLLFKYFGFDFFKARLEELCEILRLNVPQLRDFIAKYFSSIIGCLGQFSLDMVRSTYFYNYRSIYLNEVSQIVMLDYLAVRLVTSLFTKYPQQLGCLTSVIYKDCYLQEQAQLQKETLDLQKDHFDKWNKLLSVLMEIVYSPKIQIISCIFLKQFDPIEGQAQRFLIGIIKKLGAISKQDMQALKNNIFFGRCRQEWIAEVLVLNPQNQNYVLKEKYRNQQIFQVNFDLMVSLAHTELNFLIKNESPNRIQLSQQNYQLVNTLLNENFTNSLLASQLDFAKNYFDMEEMFRILPQVIRITQTLALFTRSQQNFVCVHDECIQIANNMCSLYLNLGNKQLLEKSKDLVQIIQQLLGGKQQDLNQKKEEQKQRRKALLNAKKEKLMRERKIKQNQQIYIQKNQVNVSAEPQSADLQECLICKEKEKKWNLCYLSKVRLNNVLFDSHKFSEKHFMFYSCFHMVHFDCFQKETANRKIIPCPLCQYPCNIVIPEMRAFPNNPWLPQLYHLILKRLSEKGKSIEALSVEGIVFLGYFALVCLDRDYSVTPRQLQLFRSIYNLIVYEHIHYQREKREIIEQFITTNDFNLEKNSHNNLRKYFKNVIIFLQNSIKIRLSTNHLQFTSLASHIATSLKSIFSESSSQKIVFILDQFVSGTSSQLQNLPKIPENYNKNGLIRLQKLPSTLRDLFMLRDEKRCKKSITHTKLMCILCGQFICGDCGDIKQHTIKLHIGQTLYFNLQTGGLRYYHQQIELAIRSLFVDQLGTVWHPKRQSVNFNLDQKLYSQICRALKNGNLLYYLTHTFEGLKGKIINDII